MLSVVKAPLAIVIHKDPVELRDDAIIKSTDPFDVPDLPEKIKANLHSNNSMFVWPHNSLDFALQFPTRECPTKQSPQTLVKKDSTFLYTPQGMLIVSNT